MTRKSGARSLVASKVESRPSSFIRELSGLQKGWQGRRFFTLVLALGGLALAFFGILRHERLAAGLVDPLLGDAPADWKQPFVESRRDARMRRRYREPAPRDVRLSNASSGPAQTRALDSVPDGQRKKLLAFYETRCASCHGSSGDGKGPAAGMIKPVPRSFCDKSWQQTVSDEQLALVIVKGGAAIGKSYMMPASIDLLRRPDMTTALVQLIRSFGESSSH